MKVKDFNVRIILNSKAEPTLEVCVNGFCSSPPSGTSRSSKEVEPWPEGGTVLDRVRKARELAEEILKDLKGKDVDPAEVEEELIHNKHTLGGNTLLAISLSLYKAEASYLSLPLWRYLAERFGFSPSLPRPLENVVGGGKHGGGSDIQEFLLFPDFDGSVSEWILALSSAYHRVKELLREGDRNFVGSLTLESAWVSSLTTEEVLALLSKIAEEFGLGLGMDVAASEMYDGGYHWRSEGIVRDREAQMDYIEELAERFGVYYIEDPLEENDVEGFVELQRRVKGVVVGDDLFATDASKLTPGIGGVIIKYNQRGSVIETVETVRRARELGMKTIVSHRSGETDDTFLSHFAVGVGADFIKAGAAGIRIVKLNELLRIGEELQ